MKTYKTKKLLKQTQIIFLTLVALFLSGCKKNEPLEPLSTTSFKLNTVITITLYDSNDQALLDECLKICDKYEQIFSRTAQNSEVYQLNHRLTEPVAGQTDTYSISPELAELLSLGLYYSEQSEGAFDVAIAPLTSLWDFTAENPQVPDSASIQKALASGSYKDFALNENEVTISNSTAALDLGGIAKGYIADQIKKYLISKNVKSATINLGGNILCIGKKPDGSPFRIGVQKPFADRSETIAVMEINDKSVVSSGIYERCFEQDGQFYHHILNPKTGYPYENDLISVTIISDCSADGDALSTTCFALGFEKGLEYIQSLENIHAIFITDDYQVHYTDGFQEEIPVTETK